MPDISAIRDLIVRVQSQGPTAELCAQIGMKSIRFAGAYRRVLPEPANGLDGAELVDWSLVLLGIEYLKLSLTHQFSLATALHFSRAYALLPDNVTAEKALSDLPVDAFTVSQNRAIAVLLADVMAKRGATTNAIAMIAQRCGVDFMASADALAEEVQRLPAQAASYEMLWGPNFGFQVLAEELEQTEFDQFCRRLLALKSLELRISPTLTDAAGLGSSACFETAQQLHSQRRLLQALSMYSLARALEPLWVEPTYYCGVVLGKLGEHSAALHHFEDVIRLKPDYEAAYSQACLVAANALDTDTLSNLVALCQKRKVKSELIDLATAFLFEQRGDHRHARTLYQSLRPELAELPQQRMRLGIIGAGRSN